MPPLGLNSHRFVLERIVSRRGDPPGRIAVCARPSSTASGAALSLEERPEPRDAVIVRVRGAGVCHTDVHLATERWPDLRLPLVLGHEIAGKVAGVGPVLVYASWGCRECHFCLAGEEQPCPDAIEAGWSADGGYAEWVGVPSERYVFPLTGLDPVQAAPLADAGITPYRAVCRVRERLGRGARPIVIGCGGLGQFAIQYLKLLTDARVLAVDRAAEKQARALALGADDATSPEQLDEAADVVLDFVGSNETLAQAAAQVTPKGCVVQVGEETGTLQFALGRVPHEASFTTSLWGSLDDLTAVLELALRGELRWEVETLPLQDVNLALSRVRRGEVNGRLVLVPRCDWGFFVQTRNPCWDRPRRSTLTDHDVGE
jgi:alcohol dehydrogenase, propanol-preferring